MSQVIRAVVRIALATGRAITKRAPQAVSSAMRAVVTAILGAALRVGLAAKTIHRFECYDRFGNLKWVEEVPNLVVNEGLNFVLSTVFKGSAYTADWYVGLKGSGTIAAGDTLASHGGWSEITAYSGDRKGLTFGSVASQSVDNSASPASFAINGTATVAGGFVTTAESGTSGTIYGVSNFSSARDVEDGDTLNVTVTATAADAG